jgi:hypothetical protein
MTGIEALSIPKAYVDTIEGFYKIADRNAPGVPGACFSALSWLNGFQELSSEATPSQRNLRNFSVLRVWYLGRMGPGPVAKVSRPSEPNARLCDTDYRQPI